MSEHPGYTIYGELITPFYLNNYILPTGKTHTIENPLINRQDSIAAVTEGRQLNCRISVTRVKGLRHRPDYEWVTE